MNGFDKLLITGVLLKKQIAVSFEDGTVKVAYGELTDGTITITRTLILKDEEFDDFLVREKADKFIVTCHFSSFYQEIFAFPPTQEKYLKTLVETEIRKTNRELKNFSSFYMPFRERLHEGRMVQEVFAFAVDTNEIMPIIDRFTKYGKRISKLFPDCVSIAKLISVKRDMAGETILSVLDSGKEKTICVVKEGNISFMRVVQSRQAGFDEYDMNNINMTVNYARQTLRENPSRIILITPYKREGTPLEGFSLPTAFIEFPAPVVSFEENKEECILPIAALSVHTSITRENLLPPAYQGFLLQRTILTICIAFFLICSLAGLGYVVMKSFEAYGVTKYFGPLRQEIERRQAIYTEYVERKRQLEKYMPYIKYVNDEYATPDVQKALILLQSISHENIMIKEVELKNDRQQLIVELKGLIFARTYSQLQSNFENLLSYAKKVEGMEIVSQKLDLKTKDFVLNLRWKI